MMRAVVGCGIVGGWQGGIEGGFASRRTCDLGREGDCGRKMRDATV
jgi:hypothetical protein